MTWVTVFSSVCGVGAGIDGGDGDRRRRDRRELRDRQGADGEHAGQHHHHGDHPGEDRPVDEEARHGAVLASRRGGARRDLRAGMQVEQALDDQLVAGASGRSVTSHLSPIAWPVSTIALGHDIARPDHQGGGLAALVARDAGLRRQQALRPHALDQPGAHVQARQQHAVRIGEDRPHVTAPVVGSTVTSVNCSSPVERIDRAVSGRMSCTRRCPARPGDVAACIAARRLSRSAADWVTST